MKPRFITMILLGVAILGLVVFIGNGYLQNRLLFDAISMNDYDAARAAIEFGAFLELPQHLIAIPEIVMTNPTPLITACKKGNQDIVTLLLEYGADVNRPDNCTNETPLLAALQGVRQNRFSLAFCLIHNGANIHMVQQGVNSALQEAILISRSDSEETVAEGYRLFQYLMDHEVDTAIQLPWESTLTYAVHYRNHNVVRYLLENGYFAIDELDPNGNTALIVAVRSNQLDMVKLLLDLGAAKDVTDVTGKTAYDYALDNGYEEIATLLDGKE